MDFVHGGGHFLNRILVPEAGNLVFGVNEGMVFAFTGYEIAKEQPEILSTVEISAELVDLALALASAKAALKDHLWEIKSYVE